MNLQMIKNQEEKEYISRTILESLPDWFGIPEAREEYIRDSYGRPFFCAYINGEAAGFLYLKETGKHTVELAVMGVRKEYHRRGAGKLLLNACEEWCRGEGLVCLTVKTLDGSAVYPPYDGTRAFYRRQGFIPLEVFPTFWDEENPCLFLAKML